MSSRLHNYRQSPTIERLAILGVAAPVVFTAAVLIVGALQPGYDHASQQISELGAEGAPYALLMNVFGFGVTGILTIAFAVGLHLGIGEPSDPPRGAILIGLGGLALSAVAFLQCEPGCEFGSGKAIRHSIAAILTILCSVLAEMVFFPSFRANQNWQGFAWFSLISGFLSLGLGSLFIASYASGLDQWVGVSERALVGTGLIWMAAVGIHLYRLELR